MNAYPPISALPRLFGALAMCVCLVACGSDDEGSTKEDTMDVGSSGTSGSDVGTAGSDSSTSAGEDAATEDAIDNDVGEDVGEDVVEGPCAIAWITRLQSDGGTPIKIFAYEASRPDATASTFGQDNLYTCSRPGVLPWVDVNYNQAKQACARIGARLCDGPEWDEGCHGEDRAILPYGDTYEPETCNTIESADGCIFGECRVALTGAYTGCVSELGVFDMSGNAAEWVDQKHPSDETYGLRGGSFQSGDDNTIRCRNAQLWREPNYRDSSIGFRCCKRP